MKRDITELFLRALMPPETGRIEVLDARQDNLMLRLNAGGAAVWSVRTRTREGKQVRITLGKWPGLGISEARKRASAVLADVWRGADPTAEKRAARAELKARAEARSVSDGLIDWQDAKAPAWSPRYAREVARVIKAEVPRALGSRLLAEVSRQDWTKRIAATHRRSPAVGAMLYRTLAAFLAHAEAHGWIETHPLPRKGAALIAPPVASRERVLTDQEMIAIWHAAGTLGPKPRAFVHVLMMTACREMEAADLAPGELDIDAGLWRLPASRTKNGRPHTMPAHPLLLTDLRAIWPNDPDAFVRPNTQPERAAGRPGRLRTCPPPPAEGPGGPPQPPHAGYRLLGAIKGGGLRGFSAVKVRLDQVSGVTGWRFHDLRRTARTTMTLIGVERDAAEAALNHISHRSGLERVYDRADPTAEALAALKRWQAHLAALIEKQPTAEIIPLRASA